MRFKSIQIYTLLLFVFISGCSSLILQNKSVKKYNSYVKAIDSLSMNLNHYIQQEMNASKLPLVLDVYIEDFAEFQTHNAISYGNKLRKDFKVSLSEQRAILKRKTPNLQSNIIFYFSNKNESKIYAVSGSFYQVDKKWAQVNVNLYNIPEKQILTGFEARFPISDVEPDYFKDFASQVEVRFQAFKEYLRKYSVLTLNQALEQKWDPLFTAAQTKETAVVADEILAKDIEEIFQDAVSIQDIDKKVRMIDFLLEPIIEIEKIDYRFTLKKHAAKKFITRKMKLWDLKSLPRAGIKTILSFIAESSSNEPLQFNCSGIVHNKTIDLTINRINFISKLGSCSTEEEKQIMSWRKSFLLKPGTSIPIWVTERNVISRNVTINGHIVVTSDDILEIFQKGQKAFPIKGSEYFMRFYKK